MLLLEEFSIMNEFDERQRKRRNYEREQEDLQLIAQEKERIIKKVWLNFSILSLLVWILYGAMVSSLKAEYINLVVIITLLVQILLFARAVLRFEPKESPRIYKNGEVYNDYTTKGKSITINGNVKKSDIYHAEYSVRENSYLEDNIKVQNGKIIFENEYKDSSGYILPIIIMRSGVRTNDDTDIISSFQIDIQEKEEARSGNLENINSQEVYSGSSSNVT